MVQASLKEVRDISQQGLNKITITEEDLHKELSEYERNGIALKLNGIPSDALEIAKVCVLAENGVYMRDYVSDTQGKWIELGFDFVRDSKEIGQL